MVSRIFGLKASLASVAPNTVITVGICFLTFRLLEISWSSSIILTTLLVVFSVVGGELAIRFLGTRFGLGVNIIIGSSVFVIAGQVLLAVSLNYVLVYVVLLSVFGLVSIASIVRSTHAPISGWEAIGTHAFLAVSIGLLGLSVLHPWLIPFALAPALIDLRWRLTNSEQVRGFAVVGFLAVGWGASWCLRPEKWWYFYQGNDAQFFESLSWSIARWGVLEHPGYVGGQIADYHWFSYGLLGMISNVAMLRPWDSLMKVGPLLLATIFASLFLRTRSNLPRAFTARWALIVLAVLSMELSRTDSLAYSLAISFALISAVHSSAREISPLRKYLFFIFLSFVLIFTKVSTSAVVMAVLAAHVVIQRLRKEQLTIIPTLSLAVASTVSYLLFFRGNDSGMLMGFSTNLSATWSELRDLVELRMILCSILVCLLLLCVPAARSLRKRDSLALAVIFTSVVALSGHLILVGKTTRYFGLPGIWLLTLLAVWKLDEALASGSIQKSHPYRSRIVVLFLAGFVGGFLGIKILRRLDADIYIEGDIEEFLWSIATSSGPLFVLLLATPLVYRLWRRNWTTTAVAFIALGLITGQMTEQYQKFVTWGSSVYESPDPTVAVFGPADLVALGKFVRQNTSAETVLASNQFCCFGETWLTAGHSESEFRHVSVIDDMTETRWGGASYLLPAETRRRFLVQGLRFQIGTRTPNHGQVRRIAASLEFANRPSRSSLWRLKEFGVSGYVVNLSLTDNRDWDSFAKERFRTGQFVYLELR